MRQYEFFERPGLEEALGEARAREARRLVDRAVRSSASGIVITDARRPGNPIVYVNPAFEFTTGYGAAEALGRNCRFLQADDRDQPALGELRAAIREGRECRVVLRNYKKDGTLFYNELSVSPVRDEGGRIVNFVGVQDDVTGRKRVEEELAKSEERLRLATEATGLGTWDYDLVAGDLRWDERCKAIFGLPPDEDVDYDAFLAMLHPEDRERVDRVVGEALDPEGGGAFETQYRTVLPDGTERWGLARGRTVFREGRAVRFVGTVLDITERKRAEAERERLLAREQTAREEAEATRKRLALQARAGTVLSASLDYEATLARVARLTIPEFADFCMVDVLGEDGSLRQLAYAHADPAEEGVLGELARYREHDAEGLEDARRVSASVLRSGEAVLLFEAEMLTGAFRNEEHRALVRRLHPRSCICAPLVARGRTLGTITFARNKPGSRYDPEDLSLAESLTARCASAIDNARLYAYQTRVARALQGSLLPSYLPEVPGFEVGLHYLPAGEANIGGDFYDLFEAGERSEGRPGPDGERPPSSWGVAVGDVSGKGPDAAAVLALARYTIRAAAMHRTRPASILADLNEAMLRHGREREARKFCTVAYARVEPDGRGARVSVSRGGHPAPMLLRADGAVRPVGYAGRAMGVFADPRLTEQEARLEPGDALVLFTDGVTEARAPDGTFFGEERFADLLRSSAGLDATALTAHLGDAVCGFQNYDLNDDVAILVLRAV
ncbi:SpoIIE family protein phosphatase [Rubrobacter marinus]|nr:GAF domain-containing SpoIIE family protein phosphatase [Rubrobacter marinus]